MNTIPVVQNLSKQAAQQATPGPFFAAEMILLTLAYEHIAAWEDHAFGADSALQFAKFCLWLAGQIQALYPQKQEQGSPK